jgi:hypothetical protein
MELLKGMDGAALAVVKEEHLLKIGIKALDRLKLMGHILKLRGLFLHTHHYNIQDSCNVS